MRIHGGVRIRLDGWAEMRLENAGAHGSGMSVAESIYGAGLERLLDWVVTVNPSGRKVAEPDWSVIGRERKRKHVSLQALWDNYSAAHCSNLEDYAFS